MSTSPAILTALRHATRADHQALEEVSLGNKIMDGSLSAPEYRRLIDWQRRSHLVLEPQVAGFQDGNYGYRPRFLAPAAPGQTQVDRAGAVGILYVLEGASLGGSLIYRKLQSNPALAGQGPFTFYRDQADWGLQQWRAFVNFLGRSPFSPADIARATAAAREAFATFRREWTRVP
ncbi:heme oxygenase [Lewinella marina]|uniref:Heme oxygenase n=1 Tax=Neolewinella marina TaxID=438751 RepID=A0A2G0CBW2_9BACT|nr:biliverdin-producing heme oxygenase [Neolewinella marina]NJB86642.1 heme oxygenase [Neolewinella marina]PHK97451.1 hypothetical protein CGL56_15235 [Neolewinella marina]